ncbi:nucleolus and neural progenitor protein [Diabrotica undecimpunctata]|uniref:nucleolus and neural progenitor protein n=1 Tax=Diabrotica undecimpunctata TaxID=50387 RepID=UPI003B635BFA
MDAWNLKFLPYPAISTFKTVNHDLDLDGLTHICNEFKRFFKKDRHMEAEYLVLSRIVYRMKQKFRTSKDFKFLERIYKCLKVYFNMNLPQYVDRFSELIPRRYKLDTRLPSRNLLDYILIRVQGATKLLEKMVDFCKEAADLLLVRIKTGQFWKVALIVYSIVSRIYTLAKFTVNQLCEVYKKLIGFSKMLLGSKKWLPQGYILPDDLKEWLNISWLDDDIQIIEPSLPTSEIMKFFDLVDDSDIEFCDEYILIQEEKDDKDLELLTPITTFKVDDDDEDPGVVIEIDDIVSPVKKRKRTMSKIYRKEKNKGNITKKQKLKHKSRYFTNKK